MSAKQSRFSKRRPKGGVVAPEKNKAVKPVFAEEYNLGIFIDDMRQLSDVVLPKAENWLIVRDFYEFRKLLDEMENQADQGHFKEGFKLFVSFDHYLSEDPRERTGFHCLDMFAMVAMDKFTCQIDIQGHSSDPEKNQHKEEYWKEIMSSR